MQNIAGAQGAATMAAKLPQSEGAARAQIGRALQTAGHGQIGAGPFAADLTQLEDLPGLYRDDAIGGNRLTIQCGLHVRTGEGDAGDLVEFQRGAIKSEFQPGGVFRVSEQAVAQTEA